MALPQPTRLITQLSDDAIDRLGAKLRDAVEASRSRLTGTPDLEDLSRAVYDRALHEASEALARIEEGVYGNCEACSGPIALERLEALPHATLCTGCAGRSSGHR